MLADRAGVHWTFVSQVERGLRNVNLHNLLKFADGLDLDAADLVSDLAPPGKENQGRPAKTRRKAVRRGPGTGTPR